MRAPSRGLPALRAALLVAFASVALPCLSETLYVSDQFEVPLRTGKTTEHAILRMVPSFFGSAIWGVIAMFASIAVLFLMPWLDQGKVKSVHYRGLGYKVALGLFAVSFIMLAAVGAGVSAETIPKWFGADADVTFIENLFGRFWTLVYFGFFAFIWVYTHFGMEKTRPVPERVTTHD
jgi:ubiquinol-cytochrome c reductase cytochrome b subunit